jgi:hypothetical protein
MVPNTKVKAKPVKNVNVLISNMKIDSPAEPHQDFDVLEFKKSVVFKSLEQAALIGEGLETRKDEESDRLLLDLDSSSGAEVC